MSTAPENVPGAPVGSAMHRFRWEPRVLVVDDEPVCLVAEQAVLERLGLAVDAASGGRHALELAGAWPYVAIFIDCFMPGIDGYAAARQIRARASGGPPPLLIAVTSQSRHVCLAAGMDHHIAKPMRLESVQADAASLGLVAPQLTAPGRMVPAAVDLPALAEPLLGPGPALGAERVARLREELLWRAVRHLPALWRAANRGDAGALSQMGRELSQRAQAVGAPRLAALCQCIEVPPRRASPGDCAALVAALRDVISQTADALEEPPSPDAPARAAAPPARAATPPARAAAAPARAAAAPCAEAAAAPSTEAAAAPSAEAAAPAPARVPATTPAAPAAGPGPEPGPESRRLPIRVAVVDDDPLALHAIEAMIQRSETLALVGSACGVQEVVGLVAAQRPDVVVVDHLMPGGGGPEAARRIRQASPTTRVIALTACDGPAAYLEMLRAGADGLLLKGAARERLVEMIHRTAARAPAPQSPAARA
ncbi:MAG TPA: response regulator [Solirubrobacteraceae bacterium]|nr:response regulator [Solirubrobacteraceae bacterium]